MPKTKIPRLRTIHIRAKKTRTFEGKLYRHSPGYWNFVRKPAAAKKARWMRRRGYLARVVAIREYRLGKKYHGWRWLVYVRKRG